MARKSKTEAGRIWVPGEAFENGVAVTDVVDEKVHVVPEKGEKIKVVSRSGRMAVVTAVRCELVRVEETRSGKRLAVVLVGGKPVRALVLGEWHLAGAKGAEPSDAPAEAPVA